MGWAANDVILSILKKKNILNWICTFLWMGQLNWNWWVFLLKLTLRLFEERGLGFEKKEDKCETEIDDFKCVRYTAINCNVCMRWRCGRKLYEVVTPWKYMRGGDGEKLWTGWLGEIDHWSKRVERGILKRGKMRELLQAINFIPNVKFWSKVLQNDRQSLNVCWSQWR